ncbi:MAG: DUF134 domain-containing protein [Candidatus Marinimicrobia bacterium]|nr:DUF134 domain-containing protein [Candidatus Neomarinimicrobiota bacterium]
MSICLYCVMEDFIRRPGRPKRCRNIEHKLDDSCFIPRGAHKKEQVSLDPDELEAIRLTSLEGLYQLEAARRMNISRQTLGRILKTAHFKIADSLINGKILNLKGENMQHQHRGKGSHGYCICPKCETREQHTPGQPCQSTPCPKCGMKMLREGSEHHQQWLNRRNEK